MTRSQAHSRGRAQQSERIPPTKGPVPGERRPNGFTIAKYVGQYGGIDIRLGPKPDWKEVERFIVDSYRLIAPKKLVKELDARSAASPKKRAAKKAK